MRGIWMFGLSLLSACPRAPVEPPPPPPPVGHPDLRCPTGTAASGYAPPLGLFVWCERPTPSGGAIKEGPSIEWHSSGARKAEGGYTDGKQNGPWVTYYPEGGPQSQGSYALGKKEGLWKTFHPDGRLASQGEFAGDLENGTWTFYG